MRVAMLAPISRRIPPRPYGPEEQMISDLTEELVSRGHEVFLFASGDSLTRAELLSVCPVALVEWEEEPRPDPRWLEEAQIAECVSLARRGNFDIVHNHMAAKALPFLSVLHRPVLTTLHGAGRDPMTRPILLRYKEYSFVSMDEKEEKVLPDLNYVGRIGMPNPDDSSTIGAMVDAYETLYQKLVAGEIASPSSELIRITPWGGWEVLRNEPDFKTKRIMLAPGRRLSYQRHRRRSEHWVIARGKALVTLDGKELELEPGQAVDIPVGVAHRIGNPGREEMVFIEVQRGEYFGEDDVERLEDDYGRT